MKDFLNTFTGEKLAEKFSLLETGIWDIYGEDPNCDMGGYHSEPFLARVSGTLEDVIKYAENLPGFWKWGAGGRIEKYIPIDVIPVPRGYKYDKKKEQRNYIEGKILALQAELKGLEQ